MMASIEESASPDAPPAVHGVFAQKMPMRRCRTPGEVAAFPAFENAANVNRAYQSIDGGMTAA